MQASGPDQPGRAPGVAGRLGAGAGEGAVEGVVAPGGPAPGGAVPGGATPAFFMAASAEAFIACWIAGIRIADRAFDRPSETSGNAPRRMTRSPWSSTATATVAGNISAFSASAEGSL